MSFLLSNQSTNDIDSSSSFLPDGVKSFYSPTLVTMNVCTSAAKAKRQLAQQRRVDAFIRQYKASHQQPTTNNNSSPLFSNANSPRLVNIKYTQMLKVGLSNQVITQKMTMDGKSPHEIEEFFNSHNVTTTTSTPTPTSTQKPFPKELEKYKEMLRIGLPPLVVEHKIKSDIQSLNGMSVENAIDLVLGSRKTSKASPMRREASSKLLFDWKKILPIKKHSDNNNTCCFWTPITDSEDAPVFSLPNKKLLYTYFKSPEGPIKKQGEDTAKSSSVIKAKINLLDAKRAQNIGITVARIKVPFSQLRSEILALDSSNISVAQLSSLRDLWPPTNVVSKIKKAAIITNNNLNIAEKFIAEMSNVENFIGRLESMIFISDFSNRVSSLTSDISLLSKAIEEILGSSQFQNMMHYILFVGKDLNDEDDDDTNNIMGFNIISTLPLLKKTMATHDKNLSLMQIVIHMMESDIPSDFDFDLACEVPSVMLTNQKVVKMKSVAREQRNLQNELDKASTLLQQCTNSDNGESSSNNEEHSPFFAKAKSELVLLSGEFEELEEKAGAMLDYFCLENGSVDEFLRAVAEFTIEFNETKGKLNNLPVYRHSTKNGETSSS